MVDTHPKASNDPGVREVWENPEFLVLSRLQIDSIVSNAYWDAWSNVGDEWRLYPVLSIPLTLASATMEVMFPHAAIITVPQAVFDPRAPRSDGDGNRRGGGPSVKVDTSPPPPSNSAAASRQHASYSEGLESSGAALAGRNTEAGAAVPKAAHIRLREAPRRSESPSPASRAEEPATGGTQIPPSGERELSAAPLADSKGEIPKKIPDLARYIRYNKNTNIPVGVGKMPSDKHVDAVEQKCLEYTDQWNTLGAVKAAHEDIELHIEQLYDTAMAALATHPEWMKFTVLLVIGIYFTQLEWTREDTSNPQAELEAAARERAQRSGSSEIFSGYRPRPPVTPNNTVPSPIPGTPAASRVAPLVPLTPMHLPLLSPFTPSLTKLTVSQKNDEDLREVLNGMLKTARQRSIPKVYYWNECALEFTEDDIYGTKCHLSPKFVEALSSPLWDSDVDFQPSWLNCPAGKRTPLKKGIHTRLLSKALKHRIEKYVEDTRDALREQFGIPEGDEKDEDYTPNAPRGTRPKPARTRTHADQEIMTGVGSQPLDRQQRAAKVAGDQKRAAAEKGKSRTTKASSKSKGEQFWHGLEVADDDGNDDGN